MEIEKAIFGRRSVRVYSYEKVPEDIIKEIIKAGIYAPSACNFQAWKFILIDNEKVKNELINIGCSYLINKSLQGIMVLYRNDLFVTGHIHKDYVQSAAAAIQNMLLMAYSFGIASCWVCDLPSSDKIRKILQIPDNFDVIAYISLGYPMKGVGSEKDEVIYHYGSEDGYKKHKRRYSFEQVVCYNKFYSVDGDITGFNIKKNSLYQKVRSIIVKKLKKLIFFNKNK